MREIYGERSWNRSLFYVLQISQVVLCDAVAESSVKEKKKKVVVVEHAKNNIAVFLHSIYGSQDFLFFF